MRRATSSAWSRPVPTAVRNTRIAFDASRRLTLALSSDSLHPVSARWGAPRRTALHLGPLEMREIRIVFARAPTPSPLTPLSIWRGCSAISMARSMRPSSRIRWRLLTTIPRPGSWIRSRAWTMWIQGRRSRALPICCCPSPARIARVTSDLTGAAHTAADGNWLRMGALGTGLVLASTLLDKRADQFARDHWRETAG